MAAGWMADVDQDALINEAERFGVRYQMDEMEEVRKIYAEVGYDILARAVSMESTAIAARELRGQADAADTEYLVQSAESKAVVTRVEGLLAQLQHAARAARVRKNPLAPSLGTYFRTDLSAHNWTHGVGALAELLETLSLAGDLAALGLPADIAVSARTLHEDLIRENNDVTRAASRRAVLTRALHVLLDELVAGFEEVITERDYAMVVTGKDLPSLEFTLVRGAAAANRRPAASSEPTAGL